MSAPLDGLRAAIPSDRISMDPADLRAHARDWWPLAMLRERRGDELQLPLAVVRPESTDEVSAVLRWADESRTPVVPFGGGSGVLGGASARMGAISLDLRQMDRVLEIDEHSLIVRAQAGVMGPALESALQDRVLTLGHFPQSIDISTVGGWLSARGAGQKSSRYGRIEEMVLGIEAVLAGGRILRTHVAPATAAGPDLARLFVGAEGTLGVITEATLRLHPAPTRVAHATYLYPTFEEGLEAVRAVARDGLRPAVMRLYDEADASIAFRHVDDRPAGSILVLRFEGEPKIEDPEPATRRVLEDSGGKDLGAEMAEGWWEHRNDAVAALRTIMFGGMLGPTAVVDTMEIAALWSKVPATYRSVRDALRSAADVVGCHASHVYPTGACLYFTFLFLNSSDDLVAEKRYRAAWDAGMSAALETSATVSHHHGVGMLKAPWAAREWGEGREVLRAVKRALDPNGIMNPGTLGL